MKLVYLSRKVLYHTRLGNSSRIAGRVRAFLFNMTAGDLTKPVIFRSIAFYVDPTDRGYVPSMVGGYYEAKEFEVFEAVIKHCSVFVDVGANIGLYSVIGCLRSDRLIAYAFEPVAENRRLLERNIALHGVAPRLHVQPMALSDRNGTATIHLGQSGNHSLVNDQGGNAREIETVTLDEFVAHTRIAPEIIKIDVEGHEAAVVEGAMRTLATYRPTVFMEYTPVASEGRDMLRTRITTLFRTCFAVDEASGTVRRIDPDSLECQGEACNLILTDNERHLEEIRRFAVT
jgi:FkbM family methyltransferase